MYQVIYEKSRYLHAVIHSLETSVNELEKEGWIPQCGFSFYIIEDPDPFQNQTHSYVAFSYYPCCHY